MIIFDFDGTLANTHHLILKHYNAFVQRNPWFNLSAADGQFQEAVRSMSMFQARKQLHIPLYKLMLIMPFIRRSLYGDYEPAMLFDGVAHMLEGFNRAGIELAVLSSNNRSAIHRVLGTHIDKLQFMIGNCLFRKGKILKKIAKNRPYETHTYISDTMSDVLAANAAGLNTVAVTWGLHNADFLREAKPDYIVNTRRELHTVLQNLHPANA